MSHDDFPTEFSGASLMTIGHNSIDGEALKVYVDRLEKLDEERISVVGDMKSVVDEAKDRGLDPKTIRAVLRWRKKSKEAREEELEMLEAYMNALEM